MPPRKSTRRVKAAQDEDYVPSSAGAGSAGRDDDEGTDEDLVAPSSIGTSSRKRTASAKKGKAKAAESDDREDYSPPKKKAKASAAAKGKGKGRKPKKLELFQSMPLDVLALIMGQLDTKTLLAMSRTCSAFRTLLHSSQGTSCWKSARYNTSQIPDLEATDLEEWMYASLLFDSTCHICLKPRAKTVDFDLRARACAACMRSNSQRQEHIRSRMHPRVWACVPQSLWSPPDYGFREERKTFTFFWLPTVRSVSSRLYELDGKDGFDDYVKRRKKDKAAAKKDAANIRDWENRHHWAERHSARDALANRQRKIKENLLALGYTAEEAACHAVQAHSSYNQETELTDRAWSIAKPKLVAAIEEHRVEVRQRELAAAMKARGEKLKPYYDALHLSIPSGEARMLFPPWGNFLHLPTVKQLYEPEDASSTDADLNAARAAVMSEARAFGAEIRSAFYEKLVKAYAEAHRLDKDTIGDMSPPEELDHLVGFAVTCPGCYSTMGTFPAILDHYKVCATDALTADSLVTSSKQFCTIAHVLDAVNAVESVRVDMAKTTTGELYALGKAFECQACQPQQSAVGPAVWSRALDPKMSWAEAVHHINRTHSHSAAFPTLLYTPPAPQSDGVDNPGGFVVDDASP
ncbi:hypothetical protein JCM10450v2_000693 [Rhodotorula kratochvilovae]